MPDAPPITFFVLYAAVGALAYCATDSIWVAATVYFGLIVVAATVAYYQDKRESA